MERRQGIRPKTTGWRDECFPDFLRSDPGTKLQRYVQVPGLHASAADWELPIFRVSRGTLEEDPKRPLSSPRPGFHLSVGLHQGQESRSDNASGLKATPPDWCGTACAQV